MAVLVVFCLVLAACLPPHLVVSPLPPPPCPSPQGEPKSSAVGAVARELELPGQLRSMEVQDWAQYLCGGVNVDDLVSRVALLPQV